MRRTPGGGAVDERYYVETAARAIHLLKTIGECESPVSLAQLVDKMQWSKPSVYRLLRTLEAVGALRQQDSKGYILGPTIVALGQAALRETGLLETAGPHLRALHRALGETIVLTVLDGAEVVYLERIEADEILIPRTRIGSRLPAYCTATGQALLAGLSDEEIVRRHEGRTLSARGPNTITSMDRLLDRISAVRQQGYAINNQELTAGHRAAAAPIVDQRNETIAAVSVSVPTVRVSASALRRFADEHLVPAAKAISSDMGAPAPLAP